MSTTASNDVTFTVPASSRIGMLVLGQGEPMPIVGTVTCRPDEVFYTFLINPSAADIAALPDWVINKCQALVLATDEAVRALAQRDDVTTANIYAGVPTYVAEWYPFLELTETAGEPLSVEACVALASSANPLTTLLLSGCDLGDADVAQFAQLASLTALQIRADRVAGSFLSAFDGRALEVLEVSGASASPAALAGEAPLDSCQTLLLAGPKVLAELDPAALKRRFPNLATLDVSDGVIARGEDESPEDFATLLPLRAAFAGTDVNGMVLSAAGARRAAQRLGIHLEPVEAER